MRRAGLISIGVLVALVGLGARRPATATSRFKTSNPCTYLTPQQVKKAFGGPVTIDPTNRGVPIPKVCDYLVGAGGALIVVNTYPGLGPPPGQTAVDATEIAQADDIQAGLTIEQIAVGRHAFLNFDQSSVTVAANPRFAFTLSWNPPGKPTGSAQLTSQDSKQLIGLAKLILANVPKR